MGTQGYLNLGRRWSLVASRSLVVAAIGAATTLRKKWSFQLPYYYFLFFVSSCGTYLLVSLVDFLVLPSYLVPVYLVDPLPCLPPCTSMWVVSPPVLVLTATRGFHHIIHKTYQGLHKGKNMNERYSRLGWSLTEIYLCPFSPPQSRKHIRGAATKLNVKVDGASNIFTGLGRRKGVKVNFR